MSGVPTSVAPMPAGAFMTRSDLQRAAGVGAHEFADLTDDRACPPMPHGHRMGGTWVYDAASAQIWLAEFAAFRQGLPALEAHRRNENARLALEANQRRLHAEQERLQHLAEQHQMYRAVESEAAERDQAEREREARRGVFGVGGPL